MNGRPLVTFVLSALSALAACGSSHGQPQGAGGAGQGGEVGRSASCPASYGAVAVGSSCQAPDASCSYPEGRCWCGGRSYCGGAAPPPEVLADLARPVWQCQAVRTDGCPEEEPSGACSSEGQACSYGDCCFTALTCQGGTWVRTGGGCPP